MAGISIRERPDHTESQTMWPSGCIIGHAKRWCFRRRRRNSALVCNDRLNSRCLFRERVAMRYASIHWERSRDPLNVTCQVLQVSRRGYDAFLKEPPLASDHGMYAQVHRLYYGSLAPKGNGVCVRHCALKGCSGAHPQPAAIRRGEREAEVALGLMRHRQPPYRHHLQ